MQEMAVFQELRHTQQGLYLNGVCCHAEALFRPSFGTPLRASPFSKRVWKLGTCNLAGQERLPCHFSAKQEEVLHESSTQFTLAALVAMEEP